MKDALGHGSDSRAAAMLAEGNPKASVAPTHPAMSRTKPPNWQGRVGKAEIFRVGKMAYEIRVDGIVKATAGHLSGAHSAAQRVHLEGKG